MIRFPSYFSFEIFNSIKYIKYKKKELKIFFSSVPISTLFNPHDDQEMTAVRISPNAKYIVTVGNEFHQKVHFWLWTYGKDKPDS